jgi:hypothetical protein
LILEDYGEDGYLVEWRFPDGTVVGGFGHAVGTAMREEVSVDGE